MVADEALERQHDEVISLDALYGGDEDGESGGADFLAPHPGGHARVKVRIVVDEVIIECVFRLPPSYPLEGHAATIENIEAPSCAGEAKAIATDLLASAAEGGAEALFEACEAIRACVEEGVAAIESARNASAAQDAERRARSKRGAAPDCTPPHNAVIRIDHANDLKRYLRNLEAMASAVTGTRVLYCPGGAKRPRGAHPIFVCLSGTTDAIRSFLRQLRTEMIDVDSAGRPCAERQSEVLSNRGPNDVKEGEAPVPHFVGFLSTGCASEVELEVKLAELNLLHVGSSATRFGRGKP